MNLIGASGGVGMAIACAMAREGAEMHLVGGPTSPPDKCEQECKNMGASKVETHQCDLSDPSAIDKLCQTVGDIDVLVNNAGEFGPSGEEQGPIKGDPNEWDRVMKVNLMGPMRLTRHFAPKMVDKGDGFLINIGDVEGLHTGPRHPAYAASKHGLRGYSLSAYENLRDKGVKVCLVTAGNVHSTGMAEATDKTHAGQGEISPEDIAEACLFCFRVSGNCVPSEVVLKAVQPHA